MCWSLFWVFHQMGCSHIRCTPHGGVTEVDHENAQLSRLETLKAVVVASPKSLAHRRAPHFALKYPCNPPPLWEDGDHHLATAPTPPQGRLSHTRVGDSKGGASSQLLHQASVVSW